MIAKRNRKAELARERSRDGGRPLLRRDGIGIVDLVTFVSVVGCADCGFEGGACDCTWWEEHRDIDEVWRLAA